MLTNTKNTPVEALEREFPMRVLRYRLRGGSGGAGLAGGGDGIERDVLMLEDVTVSLVTERRVSQPWGLAGGSPGAVGENWVVWGGDESRAERLPPRCTVRLRAGDVLRMLTPGGGGWGTAPVAASASKAAELPRVVAVRDATLDDLASIALLFNALIPTTTIAWRDDVADENELRAWWAQQQEQQNPVLVAEADGEIVGYITWTWFRGWKRFPGYRHTRELTIHVGGDMQGRGVGRQLIEALVERARASDVHVLVAAVDGENDASVRFHERLGFTEVGRMPRLGRKFDRWLDLVLMQRTVQ